MLVISSREFRNKQTKYEDFISGKEIKKRLYFMQNLRGCLNFIF